MKVIVTSEQNRNDDGADVEVSYSHDGIECVQDLAWVFAEAARAMGFTYIESVTFTTDEGRKFTGDF